MLTILLALMGAAAGYVFSPKIAGGVSKEAGAAAGGIAGLLFGLFLKPLIWIGIIALLAAGAYYFFTQKAARR